MDSLLSSQSLEEQSFSLTINMLSKGISGPRMQCSSFDLITKELRQKDRLYLYFTNYLNRLYNKHHKVSFNKGIISTYFTFLHATKNLESQILTGSMLIKKGKGDKNRLYGSYVCFI